MNTLLWIGAALPLLALGGQDGTAPADDTARLSQLAGSWSGELAYVDFGSGERVGLPAAVEVGLSADGRYLTLEQTYSDPGREVHGLTTLWIDPGGSLRQADFSDGAVAQETWHIEQRWLQGAAGWVYRLTREGSDGGRPAQLRRTLRLGEDGFRSTLEHRPLNDSAADWSLRNELTVARRVPDPAALIGTWTVDLRPTPDAAPHTAELVVLSVENGELQGTFYGSPIRDGRLNTLWGELHFGFVTEDGTGPYHTHGRLSRSGLGGTTLSLGRSFLSVWSAQR